jgi:hypothetical protein
VFSIRPILIFTAILAIAVALSCGAAGSGTGSGTSGSPTGSWQKVNAPPGATEVNFVAFNNSNHWFLADQSQGFFRSTDQGATWTQINAGLPTTLGWTINVNPANGDLIASTFTGGALNANPVQFFRSSDEGNSWILIPSGHLSSVTALTGCVFAANTNIVCGGYWAPSPGTGAWVSSNGGQSTVSVATTSSNSDGVFALGRNPETQDLWFGTEQNGMFRSTDNGLTWAQESLADQQVDPAHGIPDSDIYGITFDRSGNVLFASQGGVWKSAKINSGYTWTNVLNNAGSSAGKGLTRDANGNLYYGHDQDPGNPTDVYLSTDNGATWAAFDSGIPPGLQGRQFAVNPSDRKLYAVITDENTSSGWLYRTVNPVQ